jgi:acyl-CoA hydrolase
MPVEPTHFSDCETLVDTLIDRVGQHIVVGLPLGLGKANHIINALYRRARKDADLSLTIFTALTLETPRAGNELQQRFLKPVSERLFDDYPALEYAQDMRKNELPDNIEVKDFYLQAGNWLRSPLAQQAYTSVNYTHALNALIRAGVNVVLQLVAASEPESKPRYSLSCNADISADLLDQRRSGELNLISVGQVNAKLPFLGGEAERPASDFDYILENPAYEFPLYCPPHKPVNATDYAIGLQVASLVPDGGTLQIGIGSIGDAISHGLLMRHQDNSVFGQLVAALYQDREPGGLVNKDRFEQGLYGLTEMLVEGFLAMIKAGVVSREVGGAICHGAFFVGSPVFYELLEQLPPETRGKIAMMPVSFTNELYNSAPYAAGNDGNETSSGLESQKRRDRVDARFINSAMMVTLSGAVVSDGLEDGRVVSGVGGQHNFVSQAFALPGGRAVITLPSTRTKKGRVQSNIVWNYGHITIPRHLRDIVVTEYGVADLRDKSDAEVMSALINIADSRFQKQLLAKAKDAKKIPDDYEIPGAWHDNSPDRIRNTLSASQRSGKLPAFPLGSGLTDVEEHLAQGLAQLAPKAGDVGSMAALALQGIRRPVSDRMEKALARMQLDQPKGFKEQLYRALLVAVLEE